MTSAEIAKLTDVTVDAVNKWAAKNSVPYTGEGRRKIYPWNEADLERFKQREGPGRRWH
jgi:phage antirepressor YoqD-like protein